MVNSAAETECLSGMTRDSIQDVNQHIEADEFFEAQQDLPGEIISTIQTPTWQAPLAISQICKYLQLELQVSPFISSL